MPSYYKLEIDVSPHVKKYIAYHLCDNPVHIDFDADVKLDKNHHIGLFILSLIQKQYKLQKNKKDIKYNNKKINAKVNVLLSERYEKDIDPRCNMLGIDENGVRKLDMFVDGLFRQELFLYLNSYQMVKGENRKIKEGALLFYKKYSLTDEDIPLDTLLKSYNRYRLKNKFLIIN
ncbi:MAG: hypothetical protein J5I47_01950 [Vicingus serpentipes]|nr:hypothetical protein [Vicingus serpentipes]